MSAVTSDVVGDLSRKISARVFTPQNAIHLYSVQTGSPSN